MRNIKKNSLIGVYMSLTIVGLGFILLGLDFFWGLQTEVSSLKAKEAEIAVAFPTKNPKFIPPDATNYKQISTYWHSFELDGRVFYLLYATGNGVPEFEIIEIGAQK